MISVSIDKIASAVGRPQEAQANRDARVLQAELGNWVRVVSNRGAQWIGVLHKAESGTAETRHPPHSGSAPQIWRKLDVGYGHVVTFPLDSIAAIFDQRDQPFFGSAKLAERLLEIRQTYPRVIVTGSCRRAPDEKDPETGRVTKLGGWMLPGIYYATPQMVHSRKEAGFGVEVVPADSRKLKNAAFGKDHTKDWSGDIQDLLQEPGAV